MLSFILPLLKNNGKILGRGSVNEMDLCHVNCRGNGSCISQKDLLVVQNFPKVKRLCDELVFLCLFVTVLVELSNPFQVSFLLIFNAIFYEIE